MLKAEKNHDYVKKVCKKGDKVCKNLLNVEKV